MKVFVVTDEKGKIVGTGRASEKKSKDAIELKPIVQHGQKVHEVELPANLYSVNEPDKLHQALRDLIK